MPLHCLGINHKTAPVELREQVAFGPEQQQQALGQLRQLEGIQEAALLSTCNRTELFLVTDNGDHSQAQRWLANYHQIDPKQLKPHLYAHRDNDMVSHLLRVAAGLDSLILGEPQILGQIKDAYRKAQTNGSLGVHLEKLFQHSFAVAKQIRTDTAIGSSPVSVAFAAVSLSKQIFADLDRRTALMIGAGETIELAARHLHENGLQGMIVANRSLQRAHDLAGHFGGYAISLKDIPKHLHEADIVIASTASPEPILHLDEVKAAVKKRRHRPIFMVDLAVPRDIETAVGDLDDIYLYTVDDLQSVVEEGLKTRQQAAEQAHDIIDIACEQFQQWLNSRNAVDTICAYRHDAEQTRNEALEKAKRQLAAGKAPEDVLRLLANSLTNKLIHTPTQALRQAGEQDRQDLIDAATQIFGLTAPQATPDTPSQ